MRTWHLHAIPRPPVDGVIPAPAGAQGRLRTLDPVAQLLVSLLSAAVGPNLEGADSHPQSHSICLTVLNENWVISKLPVRPSRALSVQQICCSHPSLASALWFPQKRQQSGQELPLPSSTTKTFWDSVAPALLSPPHTCKPPETHTCIHTRVPFPHCPPLPTSYRFPCSPPTPWLSWKEPPRSLVLLSPPRTVAWNLL